MFARLRGIRCSKEVRAVLRRASGPSTLTTRPLRRLRARAPFFAGIAANRCTGELPLAQAGMPRSLTISTYSGDSGLTRGR